VIDRFRSLLAAGDAFELDSGDGLDRHFAVPPRVAVRPADAAEAAAALRLAADLAAPVVPWGGATHQDIGNVPRPVEILLATSKLEGIVEYDPGDQTITVGAGTRLADLMARIRQDSLMLPLDPPGLSRATVGGVIAAAACGPLRHGYGPPRDHLLGTLTAHSDGKLARSGGRLVKNVTGFDLHRLYCGSLGTLALLCEVSLRLRPLPERDAALVVAFGSLEDLDDYLVRARSLPCEPVSLVVLDAAALERLGAFAGRPEATAAAAFLRFHGLEPAVERALLRAEGAAGESAALAARRQEGAASDGLFALLREARSRLDPRGVGVLLELGFEAFASSASRVGGAIEALNAVCLGHGEDACLVVEPPVNRIAIHLAAPPSHALLDSLQTLAARLEGSRLSIRGGPLSFRENRDVYFGTLPHAALAQRLKEALDPGLVMSPKRLHGGPASARPRATEASR
jgi:FAD/FMN-containing dehydrogenase